jgi:hypothetical protein
MHVTAYLYPSGDIPRDVPPDVWYAVIGDVKVEHLGEAPSRVVRSGAEVRLWYSRPIVGVWCSPPVVKIRRRPHLLRSSTRAPCRRTASTCQRRTPRRRTRRTALTRQGGDPPGEPAPDAKNAPPFLPGIGAPSQQSHLIKDSRLHKLSRPCLSTLSHRVGSVAPGFTAHRLIEASASGHVSPHPGVVL